MSQPAFQDSDASPLGSAVNVLLLVDSPPVLRGMQDVIASMRHVRVAGAFARADDLVDALTWKGGGWQVAFIDFALRAGNPAEAIKFLLSQEKPGAVVVLGDPRWQLLRNTCLNLGACRVLERGDLNGFRAFLQEWVHDEAVSA